MMERLECRVRERRAKGLATYGTTLQAFNGRRALVDAAEEAVDMAAYLEQEIEERERFESVLCAATFVQGQLLGALLRIVREDERCHCEVGGCGCGMRCGDIASEAIELLSPPPWSET